MGTLTNLWAAPFVAERDAMFLKFVALLSVWNRLNSFVALEHWAPNTLVCGLSFLESV